MKITYADIAREAPAHYGPGWGYAFARDVGISRRLLAHWRTGHRIRDIYQHAIRAALSKRARKPPD